MRKSLFQVVTTQEADSECEARFNYGPMNTLVDWAADPCIGNELLESIKSAVRNLHKDNQRRGETVSRQQMERLKKISVIKDDHELTHRFTVLRNGDDQRYATYSLHY